MNKPRLLIDECTGSNLMAALRQAVAGMDLLRVGDSGAPPRGTRDPDLLRAAESLGRILVSQDKRTMPAHLVNHYKSGHHTAGVMLLRQGFAVARYVQEIVNHWTTTEAADWIDRTVYIP